MRAFVCDGVQALSLCDIQIDTQTDISSTRENQKTEEKEQSPIGDGYPMMRNLSLASAGALIHNMSTILVATPAKLTLTRSSQARKKISVVESSDAVFPERRRIIVFHKKFAESILSEYQAFSLKIYKRFFCIYFH